MRPYNMTRRARILTAGARHPVLAGICAAVAIVAIILLAGCAGAETMAQPGDSPPIEEIPGQPLPRQVSCSDIDTMANTLGSKYGEVLQAGGALGKAEADPNAEWVALLFVNSQAKTWTLVAAQPNGQACVKLYGRGWGDAAGLGATS